ncbi:hypothetical protein ACFWMP_03730 [Paenibacillus sp. NPDC058367]|uniref:hypothetical protein n=1 Tax=Paenibacillus sp. NPDC058367 TaxID=3346460 RepID=UPI00364ED62B
MNEKLKEAYERLDLPVDITREELNKKFDLHLKRRKSNSSETEAAAYEEEFLAYKTILDGIDQQEIQEAEDKRLEKWGAFSGIARKSENFFRLYKVHTFVSIVVLLVLIFGGNALYNQYQAKKYEASLPPVDVTIMFLGNYESQDPSGKDEELKQEIVNRYPAWKRVKTEVVYLPSTGGEGGGALDMTYIQRAMAMLAADRPNILILDDATFDWIGQQQGLKNLEPFVKSAGLPLDDIRLKRIKNTENGEEWITGVDITDTKFATDLPIHSRKMIIGVFGEDEDKNKSTDFVEFLVGQMTAK